MQFKKLAQPLFLAVSAVIFISTASAANPISEAQSRSSSAYYEPATASLQAQAAKEVIRDTVRITLAAELSDTTQDAVSKALSERINQAMDTAKQNAVTAIKVSSGNYRVWPMNNKEGQISNWRGVAEIHLESQDFNAVSALASQLNSQLAISNLSFFVSPKARAQYEAELLGQALESFQQRAKNIAENLGYAQYRIKNVDVGGSGNQYEPAPRMLMSASMKAADSIPLEAGVDTITVSVRGSVYLQKKTK